ncbi:hypothetical protein EC991_009745 [Linnemannia zychae]|nr:hypothetical protein EC991_009745 [Linnemannia zychae]
METKVRVFKTASFLSADPAAGNPPSIQLSDPSTSYMTQVGYSITAGSLLPKSDKDQRRSKGRYNQSQAAFKPIAVLASTNAPCHDIVIASLQSLEIQLQQAQGLLPGPVGDHLYSTRSFSPGDTIPSDAEDPLAVASKGRPKNRAIKSTMDESPSPKSQTKTQRQCKLCFGYGHIQKTCAKKMLDSS